jgi:hypothetical protein
MKSPPPDELVGRKVGSHTIVGFRKEGSFFHLKTEDGIEYAFQNHHKNESIIEYMTGGHTAYVVGNGPSLKQTDLNKLLGRRSYATNRIWKVWQENPNILWRPTDYVRLEKGGAEEDIAIMSQVPCVIYAQRGVNSANYFMWGSFFATCPGPQKHDWHLPMICAHGTAVHAAMQIAVRNGANKIVLLGCDLGMPAHFYGNEGIDNDALALEAHEIASRCCPVPIYNATVGGSLEVYPRIEAI